MLNKLTKIKILLILLLFVVFIIKRDSIKSYFLNSNDNTVNDVKVFDIGNQDKTANKISDRKTSVARLAIIIADLGLQNNVLEKALQTNPKINLGISIYAENLSTILKESSDNYRHDTMVLLPSQSSNYTRNDPGPHAILMDGSVSENAKKFHDLLTKLISNNIGVYLSPLSAFAFKEDKSMSLIKLLEDYDHQFGFFVYYDRDYSSFLTTLLSHSNSFNKAVIIDKIIDYGDTHYVQASLDDLKNIAMTNNKICVAVIAPQMQSIVLLESWIQMNSDKIELMSISDILKTRKVQK